MKNHKWEEIKMNVKAYKCSVCGVERYACSTSLGGWEYYDVDNLKKVTDKTSYHRPECKTEVKFSEVTFSDKLRWHYYFWLGKTKYLHGMMSSKEQAEDLKRIQSEQDNFKVIA